VPGADAHNGMLVARPFASEPHGDTVTGGRWENPMVICSIPQWKHIGNQWKPMENLWKTYGKPKENQWKTMETYGKLIENHGN
jgi:hypothetical protein